MKCHKEDAPLLGLMGQSMRLIGKKAQELYAEYRSEQSSVRYFICPSSGRFHVSEGTREAFECNAAVNYIDDQEDGAGRLYYKKSPDEQDQRVMRLTLAQKGKDCIDYVDKTAEKLEEIVFEGMTAEEKMLFRRLLLQILENLE